MKLDKEQSQVRGLIRHLEKSYPWQSSSVSYELVIVLSMVSRNLKADAYRARTVPNYRRCSDSHLGQITAILKQYFKDETPTFGFDPQSGSVQLHLPSVDWNL